VREEGNVAMKMQRRVFRIGELARALSRDGMEIEPSVIRFWEKEFCVNPRRSEKGQRYYTDEDLRFFSAVQELLYEKKFTIAGARCALKQRGDPESFFNLESPVVEVKDQLLHIRKLLIKLKKLL